MQDCLPLAEASTTEVVILFFNIMFCMYDQDLSPLPNLNKSLYFLLIIINFLNFQYKYYKKNNLLCFPQNKLFLKKDRKSIPERTDYYSKMKTERSG